MEDFWGIIARVASGAFIGMLVGVVFAQVALGLLLRRLTRLMRESRAILSEYRKISKRSDGVTRALDELEEFLSREEEYVESGREEEFFRRANDLLSATKKEYEQVRGEGDTLEQRAKKIRRSNRFYQRIVRLLEWVGNTDRRPSATGRNA